MTDYQFLAWKQLLSTHAMILISEGNGLLSIYIQKITLLVALGKRKNLMRDTPILNL